MPPEPSTSHTSHPKHYSSCTLTLFCTATKAIPLHSYQQPPYTLFSYNPGNATDSQSLSFISTLLRNEQASTWFLYLYTYLSIQGCLFRDSFLFVQWLTKMLWGECNDGRIYFAARNGGYWKCNRNSPACCPIQHVSSYDKTFFALYKNPLSFVVNQTEKCRVPHISACSWLSYSIFSRFKMVVANLSLFTLACFYSELFWDN